MKIRVLRRDTLEELTSFGDGGRQPGQFYAVHSIAVDSKGNLYTTETYEGKRCRSSSTKGSAPCRARNRGRYGLDEERRLWCVVTSRSWRCAGGSVAQGRAAVAQGGTGGEWRTYGADLASTRYSPLDQINAANFDNLEVAWRFKTDNLGPRPEFNFQSTPLMVGGVLYTTAGSRRAVVALDAATGEMKWMHSEDEGQARRGSAASALRPRPRVLVGRARRRASSTSRPATG